MATSVVSDSCHQHRVRKRPYATAIGSRISRKEGRNLPRVRGSPVQRPVACRTFVGWWPMAAVARRQAMKTCFPSRYLFSTSDFSRPAKAQARGAPPTPLFNLSGRPRPLQDRTCWRGASARRRKVTAAILPRNAGAVRTGRTQFPFGYIVLIASEKLKFIGYGSLRLNSGDDRSSSTHRAGP